MVRCFLPPEKIRQFHAAQRVASTINSAPDRKTKAERVRSWARYIKAVLGVR